MDSAIAHDLMKKDPDALIQAIDTHTGDLLISTNVDMVEAGMLVRSGPQLTDLIDEALLDREARRRKVPVYIRMLRFVFGIQMITALVVASLGYIIFYVLRYDESHKTGIITFIVSSVLLVLEYVALVVFRTRADYIIGPILLSFIMTVAICLGSLSSVIENIVPLLTCATVMVQCCTVYAYSLENVEVDPLHAAGYMLVGIPAFSRFLNEA